MIARGGGSLPDNSASNVESLDTPRPGDPRLAEGWRGDEEIRRVDPVEAEAALESIIGPTDDRRIQVNTGIPPWRMICSLVIESTRGSFRGTGWLAGPSLVMTAGHCVYSLARFGGWARRVTVTPGRSGRGAPFGSLTETRLSCSRAWLSEDKAFDVGCIHLSQPLGTRLGWFGHAAPGNLAGAGAVVAGYPEFAGSYDNLLTEEGPVHTAQQGRLFYGVDTTDGQSGAPVWLAGSAGPPTVVAIHTYEEDQTPPALGIEANSGTLLRPEILQLIQRWQNGP